MADKKKFKDELSQTVSILRLGYMFKMLKAIHQGKATMLGAEAFKIKAMRLERGDQANKKSKRQEFQEGK